PLGWERRIETPPVAATQEWGLTCSDLILPVPTTVRTGVVRSVLTQPGATTPGTAKLRFIATPPDRITSHWDISRVSFSPSATSILISVTGGSPAKDTPSASVMITRRKLSHQGSTAQWSQACPLWSTILASLGWRLLRRALR